MQPLRSTGNCSPVERSLALQITSHAGQARPMLRHARPRRQERHRTACAQANRSACKPRFSAGASGQSGPWLSSQSARRQALRAALRVQRALRPAERFFAPAKNVRDAVVLALDGHRSRAGDRARAALRASRMPPWAPARCEPRQGPPRSARVQAGAQVPARRCSHRWALGAARDQNDYLPRALRSSSRARRQRRRRGPASRSRWMPRRASALWR
jgi:hypothetical protein